MRKTTILVFTVLLMCLSACRKSDLIMSPEERVQDPDDYLSELIFDQFGDQFDYLGKTELDNGVIEYCYNVRYGETGDLAGIVNLINQNISNRNDRIKICFLLYGPNYWECPFSLSNYVADDLKEAEYNSLNVLRVNHDKLISYGTVWEDPSSYTVIPDIKVLDVDMGMQIEARNSGIIWRNIWPGLEMILVKDCDIEDRYFRTVHNGNYYTFDITHGGENIYMKLTVGADTCRVEELYIDEDDNITVLWNDRMDGKDNTSEMYYLYKDGTDYYLLKYGYFDDGERYKKYFKVFYLSDKGEEIVIDKGAADGMINSPSDKEKLAEFEEKLNSYLDYSSFYAGIQNGEAKCTGLLGYFVNELK